MATHERELVSFDGGETYHSAPEWLAEIIREQRRDEQCRLKRPHEERSRLHWSELEDGHTD